jgi:hypothetical protein
MPTDQNRTKQAAQATLGAFINAIAEERMLGKS